MVRVYSVNPAIKLSHGPRRPGGAQRAACQCAGGGCAAPRSPPIAAQHAGLYGGPVGAPGGPAAPVPKTRRWAWVSHTNRGQGQLQNLSAGQPGAPPPGGAALCACPAGLGRVWMWGHRPRAFAGPPVPNGPVSHTTGKLAPHPGERERQKNPTYVIEQLTRHGHLLAGAYAAHSTLLRHMRYLSQTPCIPCKQSTEAN